MDLLKSTLLWAALIPTLPSAMAQTFTEAASLPAVGTSLHYTDHFTANLGSMATSGTGNTWDASNATVTGGYSEFNFQAPSASPYASTYGTATLCAMVESSSWPDEWRHWNATTGLVELLGANTDVVAGGRTLCTFPFNLGNSFIDSYAILGTSFTDTIAYVASGEILAPWGMIPDVAMFSFNNGLAYYLFTADNVLQPVGIYVPGDGFLVEEVTILNGVDELRTNTLGLWPVPATDMLQVGLPFTGRCTALVRDVRGACAMERTTTGPQAALDISDLAPGIYTLTAIDAQGHQAMGRFVKY